MGRIELAGESDPPADGSLATTKRALPLKIRPANLRLAKGDNPVFYRRVNLLVCA